VRTTSRRDELKAATSAAYEAAADHFDDAPLAFWQRYGERTVDRVALQPGEQVLDACCGTGASALPAAAVVGPSGSVLGIDLSEPLLERGRAKAAAAGLDNVEFRTGDMENTGLASGAFDAVVCVFGIFFVADMTAAIAELWRLVRPGGRLAVTVWGPRIFEPATTAFWTAVERERPDLVGGFHPWTRLTQPDELRAVFSNAGVGTVAVEAEAGTQRLAAPDDWWTVVMGSGYRATVDQLDGDAAARVRAANVQWLRDHDVREIETNVIYGLATKLS
jgi:ubiquinone/menaquinone biosynthesis C-methylase UbiE